MTVVIASPRTKQPNSLALPAPGVKLAVTPLQEFGAYPNSGITKSSSYWGRSWFVDANGEYLQPQVGAQVRGDFGVLVVAQLTTSPSTGQTLFQLLETGAGLANRIELYCLNSGAIRCDFFYSDGSYNAWTADSQSAAVTSGVPFTVYLESKGGRLSVFVNGASGSSATITPNTDSSATYTVGGRTSNNFQFPGHIYMHALVDSRHFNGEHLSRNPWQVFAPRKIVVTTSVTTSDHQTVSIPAGSLSLTGYTPTVTTSDQQIISVPAGVLTLTGYVPTVTATANWTINVPAEGLVLTGFAPTVASSGNQLISIPMGALTLTAYTPVVNITENWNISIPVGTLTITGYAPTIVSGGNQTISVPIGNILLTGYTPSVTAGTNYVSIPVGSITLTGYAPTVGISGAVVTLKAGSWIRYRIIT